MAPDSNQSSNQPSSQTFPKPESPFTRVAKALNFYPSPQNMRSEFYRVLSGHNGRAIHKFFESLTAAQRLDFLQLRETYPTAHTRAIAEQDSRASVNLAIKVWLEKADGSCWVTKYIELKTQALRLRRLADYWFTLQELESESESDGDTKP